MNLIKEIDIKYFSFTSVSLEIKESTPIKKWIECGEFLKKADGATKWWIGDWLNFGEKKYGEMYTQALKETEYSYATLADIKWIADKVESSRRRENIEFSNYKEIAKLTPNLNGIIFVS